MPGTVVKRVAAGLRAARERDGMTRDETAWTWWTLPPAISGCLARRYPRCPSISSCSCWTSRNARSRDGVRPGPPDVCSWHAATRSAMCSPCSSSTTPPRTPRRRCGRYVPRALRSVVGLPCQPARVTDLRDSRSVGMVVLRRQNCDSVGAAGRTPSWPRGPLSRGVRDAGLATYRPGHQVCQCSLDQMAREA